MAHCRCHSVVAFSRHRSSKFCPASYTIFSIRHRSGVISRRHGKSHQVKYSTFVGSMSSFFFFFFFPNSYSLLLFFSLGELYFTLCCCHSKDTAFWSACLSARKTSRSPWCDLCSLLLSESSGLSGAHHTLMALWGISETSTHLSRASLNRFEGLA